MKIARVKSVPVLGRMISFLIILFFVCSCAAPNLRVHSLVDDIEVCFSPEMDCDQKLLNFIASAKKSLDFAIYDINREILVDEIIRKADLIPVRLIVDYKQSYGPRSKVPDLIAAGVAVRYGKQRGIMHHKFVIVDQEAVQTGSFNYTNNASERNHENQVYLRNPETVLKFLERFELMWQAANTKRTPRGSKIKSFLDRSLLRKKNPKRELPAAGCEANSLAS